MENITLERFSLHCFQQDISMVLRNREISCFVHEPIMVSLVSLEKSTILSRCFQQNLKKIDGTFYTFDQQTPIIDRYFKHCLIQVVDYNLGHNILGLFDVLPNFSFITSESNRDY